MTRARDAARGTRHAEVRALRAEDRDAVRRILESAGTFTADEVAVALELVDEWLEQGEASGYLTFVLEAVEGDERVVRGYVCLGPTPMTRGTYDLYWIAVDRASRGRGHGRRLLAFAEEEVARRGGRLLLIETSSQETYGGTVRFYETSGYTLEARLRDYYKPGDDKLIFVKRLG
jgi:ribosomal protein S18 acetylase RimI-like enzyme